MREVPGWLRTALIFGTAATLWWLEERRPLRRSVESKTKRALRNLGVAATAGVVVEAVEVPVAKALIDVCERNNVGLLRLLPFPEPFAILFGVLALDYTLYWWHQATHKVPLLWRFHEPHHADRDMDALTALRFHFGEVGLSVFYRSAQIGVLGVSHTAFSIWQTILVLCILFHHSNVNIPPHIERRLSRLLITPRLHGIHHSNVQTEADSNFSSGFAFWDKIHGSRRDDVPQNAIVIGVPAQSNAEDVTFTKVLGMPFLPEHDAWELPDGTRLTTREDLEAHETLSPFASERD